MAVEIIAEVGECFNGDMNNAHTMIQEAKKAGCDTVKFQILDIDEVDKSDPEYDWFRKISFSMDDIYQLIKWSDEEGIGCLFTPVSVTTAKMMVEVGCTRVKIASSFLGKTELLDYIKKNFDDIIFSTGMADLKQICDLEQMLREKTVSIMHCVSEYPTGPLLEKRGLKALDERDVHLQMMSMIKNLYPNHKVGYSDHTDDILAPIVAVAMGAEMVEKHITLDRKTPIDHFNHGLEYMGTDHVLSIEPEQLRQMVSFIRRTELIRGEYQWERSEGEKILMDFLTGRYQERE